MVSAVAWDSFIPAGGDMNGIVARCRMRIRAGRGSEKEELKARRKKAPKERGGGIQ